MNIFLFRISQKDSIRRHMISCFAVFSTSTCFNMDLDCGSAMNIHSVFVFLLPLSSLRFFFCNCERRITCCFVWMLLSFFSFSFLKWSLWKGINICKSNTSSTGSPCADRSTDEPSSSVSHTGWVTPSSEMGLWLVVNPCSRSCTLVIQSFCRSLVICSGTYECVETCLRIQM